MCDYNCDKPFIIRGNLFTQGQSNENPRLQTLDLKIEIQS